MTDQTELPFCNKAIDRVAMRRLISKLVVCFGIASTTNISDQVKVLGFQQATEASVSLGIDDLLAVPSRGWLVQDAEKQGYVSEQNYRYGSLHAVEKLRQSIEAWYATSECSKREMNSNFRMIDPLNPVHMMSFSGARGSISQVHQLLGMRGLMSDPRGQVIDLPIRRNLREGLSLTEYIISCYGARKGVVDTAVRTSDAGYLTRRLVEVVQHIAVRKKDCETTKNVALLNINPEKRESVRTISYQKLIGRVLADNVYWDARCIATRNQDISDGLAGNSVASLQPIYVRSPLTRKSIFWICQRRYGRSLAHHDLVELGEAVGIIAGQSVGEPGTQLTSRTFHTGGVFTGDIAEYLRIPFNGLIHFDGKAVYPTRTRHGHPAWMCQNELSVSIKSCGDILDFVVPAQSLLMIRNGQYVEAQQIIAEVRAKEFPLKERIEKAIYSSLKGEIHSSKFVWHVRDCMGRSIRVVREAGHIWILSGAYSDSDKNGLFHRDRDRVNIKSNFMERECDYFEGIGRRENNPVNSNKGSPKGIREFGSNPVCFLNGLKTPASNHLLSNVKVGRSERPEFVYLLLERQQKKLNKSRFANIAVQLNSILDGSDILAINENIKYQTGISGILRYGTIEVEPINKKRFFFGGKAEELNFGSWYKVVRGGNFFLIPEEVYTVSEHLSTILVTNNTIVQEGTRITSAISSKVGGLIQIEKTLANSVTIRVLPGYICNPGKTTSIPTQDVNLIDLGNIILNRIEAKGWVYLQSVTLYGRRKTSVPVRPVVKYDVSSYFLGQEIFCADKPKTQKHAKAQSLLCISHKNGEEIKMMNHAPIQLIQTFLMVGRRGNSHKIPLTEKRHLSLINVGINKTLNTFIQVNCVVFTPEQKLGINKVLQDLVSVDEPSLVQVDLSNDGNYLVPKNQSITVHSVPEHGASFLTLSPFNFYRGAPLDNSKNNGYESFLQKSLNIKIKDRSIKSKRSRFPISYSLDFEEVGLSGTPYAICYFSATLHLGLSSPASLFRNYFIDYLTNTTEHRHWYLIDETRLTMRCSMKLFLTTILVKKPIHLTPKFFNWRNQLIDLGLLISESRYFCENNVFPQSGQIVTIHQNYLLVRTGKTLLATRGATPHKISGDTVEEGDTLLTLPYDRLKSGDITQGLPKVEQLPESRPIASIPARIEDLFGRWNRGITRLIGNLWSHFLSAETSMERCQLLLTNEIRKVYESQGVQISDRHLEIIIWQLTSRVVASEDGIANVFFPGELVELSQAERMNRVLERPVFYEPIILGMTKASLNTTSFLSEASLQETTRVLAKAALRGRIDRLKGLKENVILGDIVPVGTSSPEIVYQLEVNKQKDFHFAMNGNKNNPNWRAKYALCDYCEKQNIHPKLIINEGLSRQLLHINPDLKKGLRNTK
uniref:RNA polymerase beta'' subunit n=1 Tax=Asplenium castaneoviride TaxID=2601855 RepID=UPI0023AABC02|nr:RNA polymerase beta'' subunit [Asplenium castaneoviride]YP_010702237.1 RNA polymerase beta'' subunit [Asplenium ruprechtii]WCL38416.1 RNA polymerase beta'' subunit [Asplenium castaneoviride]WCL38504.1 RNA polymerase beta'' subunit [Asplenium castaneoviride]WCL38592.1 RNA polymerase beta'' subunit [Asplenium ruprechtii]